MTDPQAASNFSLEESIRRCLLFRRRILGMSQGIQALHIASAYSCIEILDTIYFGLMRLGDDVENPDTFLMSKGHGALAQYVILEELGILSKKDIDGYGRPGGRLGDHPHYGLPGIDASVGSLGHGLPMALGMALADKVSGIDRVVYVVMSDGEMQEGTVWEAMMLAPSFGLNSIVAVADLNDRQAFARTSEAHPNFYPVREKGESFGWEVAEVDGHDVEAIHMAIVSRSRDAPQLLLAETIKGKGIKYMEDVPIWHYRSPSPEEYQLGLRQLGDG